MSGWQRRIARLLYRWHRTLGVAAALFIMLLAITGILLNHTSQLGLERISVTARPLLAWYGIQLPDNVPFFEADHHYLSQWDEKLLFDTRDLGSYRGTLRGAVVNGEMIAVATDEQLVLLLGDGQLVDILDKQTGLPEAIQRIGVTSSGEVVLAAASGYFAANSELSEWHQVTSSTAQWSTPATPPDTLRREAESRYLGEGLPLERVIADLHSGRLFTRHGPWVMDLVALILIFSTLSGLWLWWRNHYQPQRR